MTSRLFPTQQRNNNAYVDVDGLHLLEVAAQAVANQTPGPDDDDFDSRHDDIVICAVRMRR